MRIPTVRVKSDVSPGGFVVINESDRAPHHEIYKEEQVAASPHDISHDIPVPLNIVVGQIVIPSNWAEMHWKKQVKLARALGRDGDPSGDEAKAFITLKVAERAENDVSDR